MSLFLRQEMSLTVLLYRSCKSIDHAALFWYNIWSSSKIKVKLSSNRLKLRFYRLVSLNSKSPDSFNYERPSPSEETWGPLASLHKSWCNSEIQMKLASNGQTLMLYQPVHSNLKSPGSFGREPAVFWKDLLCSGTLLCPRESVIYLTVSNVHRIVKVTSRIEKHRQLLSSIYCFWLSHGNNNQSFVFREQTAWSFL